MTTTDLLAKKLDTIRVTRLKFGHDKNAPGAGVNSRSSGREERVDELVASIVAVGLLQPLAVTFDEGGNGYVVDGNRRLAALNQLVKTGVFAKDHTVPIIILDGEHAREASLAANIVRVPLHPVDQFEAFSGLCATGLSDDEIASRFGVTTKLVRMRIALGDLAPEVRTAWRAGKIAEEGARVMTLEPNQTRQAEVLAKVLAEESRYGDRAVSGWSLKQALGFSGEASIAQVEAVGRETYAAAGGTLTEDLFSDTVMIHHPEILAQLGEKAVEEKIEQLLAEGWAFVRPKPQDAYRYRTFHAEPTPEQDARLEAINARVEELEQADELTEDEDAEREKLDTAREAINEEIEAAGIPDAKRAELGCFVEFGRRGIEIQRGVMPLAANSGQDASSGQRTSSTASEVATSEAKPSISKALLGTLSEQRTIAASRALARDTNAALIAIIAGLETYGGPVRVNTNDAFADIRPERSQQTFAQRLNELRTLPSSKIMEALGAAIAGALDLRTDRGIGEDGCTALIARLGDSYEGEARKAFNARDYFERASGAVVKQALIEMGVDKTAGKKPELVERAVAQASANGWLPPELRLPESEGED